MFKSHHNIRLTLQKFLNDLKAHSKYLVQLVSPIFVPSLFSSFTFSADSDQEGESISNTIVRFIRY